MKRTGFSFLEILVVLAIFVILTTISIPSWKKNKILADVAQTKQGQRTLAIALFDYRDVATTNGMFPPAGGVHQNFWSAWTDSTSFNPSNTAGNNLHACSVLWIDGSFYDNRGDSGPNEAAPIPPFTEHYDLRVMTSPIEALSTIPLDPFKRTAPVLEANNQYDYFGIDLSSSFVLRSVGPDETADVGCEFGGFNCTCTSADCLQFGTGTESKSLPKRRPFDSQFDTQFGCEGCSSLEEALRVGTVAYSPTNGVDSTGDILYSHLDSPEADLTGDHEIDFRDLAVFQNQWQKGE